MVKLVKDSKDWKLRKLPLRRVRQGLKLYTQAVKEDLLKESKTSNSNFRNKILGEKNIWIK